MPGVAKNLYSSLGSVITLLCVLSLISVSFPHVELRQSLARPLLSALDLMLSLSNLPLIFPKRLDILLFVLGVSNPAGIATLLRFQF